MNAQVYACGAPCGSNVTNLNLHAIYMAWRPAPYFSFIKICCGRPTNTSIKNMKAYLILSVFREPFILTQVSLHSTRPYTTWSPHYKVYNIFKWFLLAITEFKCMKKKNMMGFYTGCRNIHGKKCSYRSWRLQRRPKKCLYRWLFMVC